MFILKASGTHKVTVNLEENKYNNKIQLVGFDTTGKRRVIFTLHEDGTFSRNPFANLLGIKTDGEGCQQIKEVRV